MSFSTFIPQYGNTMRCILAAKASDFRQQFRSDMLEADQADAGDRKALMQLRSKPRRELTLHDLGVDAKVGQDASAYGPLNGR